MHIRICEKNKEKIEKDLNKAQRSCTVRLASLEDIMGCVAVCKPKLPKRFWQHLRYHITPGAQTFPGSYRFLPMATSFGVGFNSWGEVFLMYIRRGACGEHVYSMNRVLPDRETEGNRELNRAIISAFFSL